MIRTARKTFLPFALPTISEEAIEEVTQVLRSGWITSGPKVKQFEMEFSDYIQSSNHNTIESVAVSSATAGLHLALSAIGFDRDSAAITTSVTFTASAEVICYFDGEPILTDVSGSNNNMTGELLLQTIDQFCKIKDGKLYSKKTGKHVKAIIPVHIAGDPCEMEEIISIARKFNLYVIEDAAHAFPAVYKNQMIGTWGDFTVFSFYATKGITTGEGGMLTTSNKKFADAIRRSRLHGINKQAFDRPSWYYEVTDTGFKYNMPDIAAALGIVQLKEAHSFWNRREEIALRYINEWKSIPGLKLPHATENGRHSWHLFRIELDPSIAKVGRDSLCEELKDRNIGSSLHFIPLFEHSYYKKKFNYLRDHYPNACQMYDRCLSLPLFAGMTDSDVEDVVTAVKSILI
ncbi:MAG: DegT/DnrJ/EryC1/StrS family aminotransferase [Leptospira sp.]|nr:DegT/DnrJ/EryC1/StrS family aminotransferase [Leptospira sp.]